MGALVYRLKRQGMKMCTSVWCKHIFRVDSYLIMASVLAEIRSFTSSGSLRITLMGCDCHELIILVSLYEIKATVFVPMMMSTPDRLGYSVQSASNMTHQYIFSTHLVQQFSSSRMS